MNDQKTQLIDNLLSHIRPRLNTSNKASMLILLIKGNKASQYQHNISMQIHHNKPLLIQPWAQGVPEDTL